MIIKLNVYKKKYDIEHYMIFEHLYFNLFDRCDIATEC